MRLITTMLLALTLSTHATEQGQGKGKPTVSVADFAQFDRYSHVKISPKGDYISALTWIDGDKAVSIYDTKTLELQHRLQFAERDPNNVHFWAGDDRIVTKRDVETTRASGLRSGSYSNYSFTSSEFFGINADGSASRNLVTIKNGRTQAGEILWQDVIDPQTKNNEYMLALGHAFRGNEDMPSTIFKINIEYGRTVKVIDTPVYRPKVLTDNNGDIRFAIGFDKEFRLKGHALTDEGWVRLDRFNRRINQSFEPLALKGNEPAVYGLYNSEGKAKGLYLFNWETGRRDRIFEHSKVSIDSVMYDSQGIAYAVTYDDGTPKTFIVERENPDAKILQSIMAQMPDKQVKIVSQTNDGEQKVVYSQSQKDPGSYYLYDNRSQDLRPLFSKRPWVNENTMATIIPTSFKTTDGLELSGYITLPIGLDSLDKAHNLPFVVKVHGGPHGVRDTMRYDEEAQLYANHGIAVMQVNFRGSGGFGSEFRQLGYRRWATDIQLDIIESARSLIDKGYADKNRMCIVGSSFGGFSAIQSATIEPELFKCAVAVNGAYDLALLYKIGRLKKTKIGQHELTLALGGYKNRLKATSPLNNLDKLKASVLVIHGEKDRRVPIEHAKKLTKSLAKASHDYEALFIDDLRHGYTKPEQKQQVYEKSLLFLLKHLGG